MSSVRWYSSLNVGARHGGKIYDLLSYAISFHVTYGKEESLEGNCEPTCEQLLFIKQA